MKFRDIATIIVAAATLHPTYSQSDAELMADISAVQVTAIKQGLKLQSEPIAASVITQSTIERDNIETIKEVSDLVPNFYIPDYGSRITSSIYVRGLGARIDQPIVGLNIDNIPILNKNGFDLDVVDISRMEILRGPQSSLYGRNTMGGVINIYTLSPFCFEGIRAEAEYSSWDSYKLRATLYERLSGKVAIAVGGYSNYRGGGAFINEYNGEACDTEQGGGGRLKIDYRPSNRTTIENTLAINTLEQGGYAYEQLSRGTINYNDESTYKRTTISEGLSIRRKMEGYTISSITGYQYLDDKMNIDNDFTQDSYFTLEQATREHSITEDIVFNYEGSSRYKWLFGAFGMYKHQKISAPVTFKDQGIDSLVLKYPNQYGNPYYFYEWGEDEMVLDSDFTNPTINLAIYHKSSYEWSRFEASAAIRLDYEYASLSYHSYTDTSYNIFDSNHDLYDHRRVDIDLEGSPNQSFIEVLPSASLLYHLDRDKRSSIYSSVSKGYKAGGYNTQIFSDILKKELMKEFDMKMDYDIDDIAYDPEQSWNYEIGAKYLSRDFSLMMDGTLFYIDTRNQQLTVFPEGDNTGRMMTNAGRSRSWGAEFTAQYNKGRFSLRGSYGYTNAKFIDYIDGDNDYGGNIVPYAPEQTAYAGVSYRQPLGGALFDAITLDINSNGAGRIYWNEENSLSQPFYALLNCSINFEAEGYTLTAWGKNVTSTDYNCFYFKSIENEFVSSGAPASYGVRLSLKINRIK